MRYYAGLDLHSTNTYIGVMDEEDRRVFKGRFPNELDAIVNVLLPFKDDLVGIVVESTFNWYWLVDGLMDHGFKVRLAHPAAFQQYKGLKFTDDNHDAFFLAKLLQLSILPEGYIMPREERQLRDMLRKRLKLVQQRSMNVLSFKSLVNRNLGLHMSSNEIKKLTEENLDTMFSDRHLLLSAKANIATMNFLKERIYELDKTIRRAAKSSLIFGNLFTVPGIGLSLGMTISMESGDISRFADVGNYASYCRCVSSKRISNNKSKGTNNRKNGNKYLAWAYMEAAHLARRYCPPAQNFYLRKASKTNKIVATKALAHKLARACFYIMRDNVPFDETRIFNKPLKERGCVSEPDRGLATKPMNPIGLPDAADLKIS
jgi:transposase